MRAAFLAFLVHVLESPAGVAEMPLHQEEAAMRLIIDAIECFCRVDNGRSAAFKVYRPFERSFSVRGATLRPAASVMKIPLAMSVFNRSARGFVDLEATVAVSDLPPTRYVSILAGFDRHRRLSVREVCRLALITSDNPLAVHLQTLTTADGVSELMRELKVDPGCVMRAGFAEEDLGPANRANLLTAEACITLLEEVAQNSLYADLLVGLTNNLRNNRIPALLPESATVAHKTGSLAGVVNDVGIVRDGAVRFAIAFLADGQLDSATTSNDIAACSLELLNVLHRHEAD